MKDGLSERQQGAVHEMKGWREKDNVNMPRCGNGKHVNKIWALSLIILVKDPTN